MHSRRAVLSATGLAVASLSGCLQDTGGPGGEPSSGLAALPAPRSASDPDLLLVTDSDLTAVREGDGPLVDRESDLGDAARQFEEQLSAFDVADVDRVTAQISTGESSTSEEVAAVLAGSFETAAVRGWIEGEVDEYESGDHGGFEWFVSDDGGQTDLVLAVSEDRLVLRTQGGDAASAAEVATETVEAVSDDSQWFADTDDHLPAVLSALDGHTNVAALSAAPGNLEGETSSSPLDDLLAGGFGTSIQDGGASVDALARFGEDPNVDAIRGLVVRYTSGLGGIDPVASALEYEEDGDVVRASAEVDEATLSESALEPFVRLPLYTYVGSLGSQEPRAPQVTWDFEQREDGTVRMTHYGGDAIESGVTVSYVSDGERYEETWDGPISAGVGYATERPADQGTSVRITWEGDGRVSVLGEHTVV